MAFTDPQSITISGTAHSLPRTSSGVNAGGFTSNDGAVKLSVSHQYGKTNRRLIRTDYSKIAADPLTAQNTRYTFSVYTVVVSPVDGFTVAEQKAIVDGHQAMLAASTGAAITKLLGGEN